MSAPIGGRVKILLVDDRPENLVALEAILHGLGHELLKVTSGEQALKRLLLEEVALILLDVQMPGMDGFETASHIKQRQRTRDIPILFLTAIDGESHQAFRGYTVGAVDYLSKPFDPWVLRAKVSVFIELYERRRELMAQAELLRRQLEGFKAADLAESAARAVAATSRAQDLARRAGETDVVAALRDAEAAVGALQLALNRIIGRGAG